jgi:hypothetical protein
MKPGTGHFTRIFRLVLILITVREKNGNTRGSVRISSDIRGIFIGVDDVSNTSTGQHIVFVVSCDFRHRLTEVCGRPRVVTLMYKPA